MIRLVAHVAVLLVAWGCSSKKDSESASGKEFPVTEVHTMDVVTDVFYVADIQALRNVEIRARVNGYLEHIYVDEGATVTDGQLLFKIDDEEYLAQLNSTRADRLSAESSMKAAQVELERVQMLVEKNVLAKTELDLAKAKVEMAKAGIDQAKAQEASAQIKLDHTSIRSPFSGVIDRIPNRLGSLISESTLMTTISDVSSVNVYFKVSEIDFLRYVKAHPKALDSLMKNEVDLVLADGSMHPARGRIETVQSEFEEGTGALALRARFANPGNLLKHGSTGRIMIRRQIKNAILIPQKAVMEIQDKNYVFLVDDNNTVQMKSFLPLQRYEGYYIVKDGLKPGQKIIFEGVENLREGSVIKPLPTQLSDVYKLPKN